VKQYKFALYNFTPGPRGAAAQGELDAMVADGWQIQSCYPNFVEVAVMWERDLPAPAPAAAAKKAKAAQA
jgi:hypothetical protein